MTWISWLLLVLLALVSAVALFFMYCLGEAFRR